MPSYQTGKVYKIVNTENDILYIGSTIQPLSVRMAGHRWKAATNASDPLHKAMRDIGIGKFSIVLVKDAPSLNKSQLEKHEFKEMAECKVQKIHLYNFCIPVPSNGVAEFGRGSITSLKTMNQGTQYTDWRFRYRENGKEICKSFSTKKYGPINAQALAIAEQNKQYPLPVDQPATPEYKVNKAYVEQRVSQKMGEIKSELDYIQDLGTLESQAAEQLRDHYDALIMSHYKRLEKYKSTDKEQTIRKHIQVIHYAQIVAERYAVRLEHSPQ